jgi:hypothetical protein
VDRWLTARTHPDRWPQPLRDGLDDDILEIPELAMMGKAPFGTPRLEGPERKHRKGPYNPEIGAPMGVGTKRMAGDNCRKYRTKIQLLARGEEFARVAGCGRSRGRTVLYGSFPY